MSGPMRQSLVAAFLLAACTPAAPKFEPVAGRDDLQVIHFEATIENGYTQPIHVPVPEGAESMLIEVQGGSGLYSLEEFVTPKGRDLTEGGLVTRGAREVGGLVDWRFPNSSGRTLQNAPVEGEDGNERPPEYTLVIRGKNRRGAHLASQSIDVRVYFAQYKTQDSCGINLDFLVDRDAAGEHMAEVLADVAERIDQIYRGVGVAVIGYTIHPVDLTSSEIELGDQRVPEIVGEAVAQALAEEEVARRQEGKPIPERGVHVLFVRRIGGESPEPGVSDPYGYSMGLPGPFAPDRGNAAVLISSERFLGFDGLLNTANLSSSLAHEIGHYFGLYHTSEEPAKEAHDPIDDTPKCAAATSCPKEFKRNIMTSSFWLDRPQSTRNLITPDQGRVIRSHPLCIPMAVPKLTPTIDCERRCDAPLVCAVVNGEPDCLPACTPQDAEPCETGSCETDELGVFVCR